MAKQVKDFLSLLSDNTFLSSISFIDFENRYVQVKRSFWNLLFKQFDVRNPRAFSYVLKDLWILRFHDVTANQMKCFFSNSISNSFIDFKNVLRYYQEVINGEGNLIAKKLNRKDIHSLRNKQFFETKGYNYYLFINNIPKEDDLDDQDVSDYRSDIDSHVESQLGHEEFSDDESQNQEELVNALPENYVELISQEYRRTNEFGDQITAPDQRDSLMEHLESIDFTNDLPATGDDWYSHNFSTVTYEDIIHINEVETLNLGTVTRTYYNRPFIPEEGSTNYESYDTSEW